MNERPRTGRGSFLGTPASVAGIDTFVAATKYNIDDYYRYHVPVAGTITEVRNIGRMYMDVFREDDGTLDVVDRDSYQFNPERGLVVIDSPEVSLGALLPIGKQIPAGAATARSEIGAHGMKRLKTSSPHGTFYVHPMIDLFRP